MEINNCTRSILIGAAGAVAHKAEAFLAKRNCKSVKPRELPTVTLPQTNNGRPKLPVKASPKTLDTQQKGDVLERISQLFKQLKATKDGADRLNIKDKLAFAYVKLADLYEEEGEYEAAWGALVEAEELTTFGADVILNEKKGDMALRAGKLFHAAAAYSDAATYSRVTGAPEMVEHYRALVLAIRAKAQSQDVRDKIDEYWFTTQLNNLIPKDVE